MNESDILCNVIDNALLHLYLTIGETSRFTPIYKRNDILVHYLKPLIKDRAYHSAKKELKNLIAIMKKPDANLEAMLIELNQLSARYDRNVSDARRLFNLLSKIEDKLHLKARFINFLNGESPKPDIIYMLLEHVEDGFIESGKQVAPVSLFLEPSKVASVLEVINADGVFRTELQQKNEKEKLGHIVLHTINKELQ